MLENCCFQVSFVHSETLISLDDTCLQLLSRSNGDQWLVAFVVSSNSLSSRTVWSEWGLSFGRQHDFHRYLHSSWKKNRFYGKLYDCKCDKVILLGVSDWKFIKQKTIRQRFDEILIVQSLSFRNCSVNESCREPELDIQRSCLLC
jgi:hypothetical protein